MRIFLVVAGIFVLQILPGFGDENLLSEQLCIVHPSSDHDIPQAPRVSPDGFSLLYEWYNKNQCEIRMCTVEGKDITPLTAVLQKSGNLSKKVENAFWHPSGKYIVFNGVSQGVQNNGNIYIAQLKGQGIEKIIIAGTGARPQFSRPNGNVIFFEHSEKIRKYDEAYINTLYYHILGQNPLQPVDNTIIPLRGPIREISQTTELSHPSLAPDGTTILFAARSSSNALTYFNISDYERQRAVALWKKLVTVHPSPTKICRELHKFVGEHLWDDIPENYRSEDSISLLDAPSFGAGTLFGEEDIKKRIDTVGSMTTIIPGYTKKDFAVCWLLGLLAKLKPDFEKEIQSVLFPKLWKTDVFGAAIEPLVSDSANVPLPQKWAMVSITGKFSVFEAGDYHNRHLYLVNMRTKKNVKLTEQGTYNSSPEISPDEQWVFFESNRDSSKSIWKARLNHSAIEAIVGGYE